MIAACSAQISDWRICSRRFCSCNISTITLHQPYATLIALRVETRSWLPPKKLIGERIRKIEEFMYHTPTSPPQS